MIEPEDRLPLLVACVVMVLGNVVGYLSNWTVFMTIVFAPVALAMFGVTRYVLHGAAFPRPLE